jgi:hypothetical protein
MSDETTAGGEGAGGEQPRVHPQDPAEGADPDGTPGSDEPRDRPQDPAEGADDAGTTG